MLAVPKLARSGAGADPRVFETVLTSSQACLTMLSTMTSGRRSRSSTQVVQDLETGLIRPIMQDVAKKEDRYVLDWLWLKEIIFCDKCHEHCIYPICL